MNLLYISPINFFFIRLIHYFLLSNFESPLLLTFSQTHSYTHTTHSQTHINQNTNTKVHSHSHTCSHTHSHFQSLTLTVINLLHTNTFPYFSVCSLLSSSPLSQFFPVSVSLSPFLLPFQPFPIIFLLSLSFCFHLSFSFHFPFSFYTEHPH